MHVQIDGGRKHASRVAHSLLVGLLAVVAAMAIAFGSTVATAVQLLAYTPIVMTGTFTADPDAAYVARAMDNFIVPSRSSDKPPTTPDYNTPVPLDTPEQAWPITGLFDLTFGRSVQIGWDDLQEQIAETTEASDGQPIIVFGYSQSAVISIHEKRRLDQLYPVGGAAPDIQFVLIGDLNRPNGGVMTRFEGAYLPFINFYFNGPAPTDTNFETVDIARQYDGFADFPLYPINMVADLNALLGILYVHTDYRAVSLDPASPDYVEGTVEQHFGDTTYYTIPTAALPLLQPLRDLGVPEPLMALVEPALRVVVEVGYDRTINPGVPTPARLIPPLDPVQFTQDVVAAVGQGIEDAGQELENPTPRSPGPTPTERVLTDLVQTNLSHTVNALTGIFGGGAADDETENAEESATAEPAAAITAAEVSKATPQRSTRPSRADADESADTDASADDSADDSEPAARDRDRPQRGDSESSGSDDSSGSDEGPAAD